MIRYLYIDIYDFYQLNRYQNLDIHASFGWQWPRDQIDCLLMMITRIGMHNVFIDNSDLTAGRHRPCTGTRAGRLYPPLGDRHAATGFGTSFHCMRAIQHAFPFPNRSTGFGSWHPQCLTTGRLLRGNPAWQ